MLGAFQICPAHSANTSSVKPDLLESDRYGLSCKIGGFHIDPWLAVPIAVITHAHSDHARGGCGLYYCATEGREVLAKRLPAGSTIIDVAYGEKFRLGSTWVSFHPAGHIRGSAQVRVESAEEVWVCSGDYKRQPDPTCSPFEVVTCDVFITEATFGLPIYRWQPTSEVIFDIAQWWKFNQQAGRPSVLFSYALGKAQRILAELHALAEITEFAWMHEHPVLLHGAAMPLTQAYRGDGIKMLSTSSASEWNSRSSDSPTPPTPLGTRGTRRKKSTQRDMAEDSRPHATAIDSQQSLVTQSQVATYTSPLVIAPPSAAGTLWMRRFDDARTGFASGWMQVRGVRRRQGYDRGFVVSDHVDWHDLLLTIQQTTAKRILVTHGNTQTVAKYLREQGLEASVLGTQYTGDEDVTADTGGSNF